MTGTSLESSQTKHPKETTRSITYRLPAKSVQELEREASNKEISQNVLVNQIIDQYLQWGRFSSKMSMIPVPAKILARLGTNLEGLAIYEIIDAIKPIIKESVMFMKGNYDLKRCIATLEDYLKASGMISDHRIQGGTHVFIIQHELGIRWSFFTEQLLKEIFHEFLPNQNIRFQTSENTVIANIALGADWNEHDY